MNWHCLKIFQRTPPWAGWLGVALYLCLCSPARAELEERWLLVFDTSSEMKKRLPGVEATARILLETSAAGQMQPGDSVGVWRFCQKLHTGEFPLTTWNPLSASVTASNLVKFVHRQWYAGDTSMAALQPALNQIIAASDRLTVMIFCDGTSEINWPPYDSALNQTFRQNFAERKKSRQPFVVLLRSQQGKLVGCTVSFPPGGINFPAFPPRPEPPKPVVVAPVTPPPKPAPNPAPVVTPPVAPLPSLIIVGKHVGTNIDDLIPLVAPVVAPPVTNPPIVTRPVSQPGPSVATSNPVPATSNHPAVKPASLVTNMAKAIVPATNNVAKVVAPAKPIKPGKNLWLLAAVGTLLLAGLFLVLRRVVRSRRPVNSLITDSLNAPKFPPPKK